jgi:hypothetical protein
MKLLSSTFQCGDRETQKVGFTDHEWFYSIIIESSTSESISLFFDTKQQVVNFKNNFLQAFDKFNKRIS